MRFPSMWYVRPAKHQTACAYAQSDQSLCWSLEYSLNCELLTKQHLEFLSLTGGCRGTSESTLVKIPHCWKSHAMAQNLNCLFCRLFHYSFWAIKMLIITFTCESPVHDPMSQCMRCPTMWHFDKCRLRRACAASF